MKGGDISTGKNWLLTERSSAALLASISNAGIAKDLPMFNHATERMVTQRCRGETAFLHDSNPLIFTSAHIFSHATFRCIIAYEPLHSQRAFLSHLERLKPAKPEWEASSMSGVTIRSIMSVSTVKVGTTMKSMNPVNKVKEDLKVHTQSVRICNSIPKSTTGLGWIKSGLKKYILRSAILFLLFLLSTD